MAITTEDALSLNQGDVVTDGTAEFTVTAVTDLGKGRFRVDLTHDERGASFFTDNHLHIVSKVYEQPQGVDLPEPSDVGDPMLPTGDAAEGIGDTDQSDEVEDGEDSADDNTPDAPRNRRGRRG